MRLDGGTIVEAKERGGLALDFDLSRRRGEDKRDFFGELYFAYNAYISCSIVVFRIVGKVTSIFAQDHDYKAVQVREGISHIKVCRLLLP